MLNLQQRWWALARGHWSALVWGSALVSTGRRRWGVLGGRRWRVLVGVSAGQRWDGTSADGCWQAWRCWALTSAQC